MSGGFTSEQSLKDINFRQNGRFFRLSDIGSMARFEVRPGETLFDLGPQNIDISRAVDHIAKTAQRVGFDPAVANLA